MVEDKRELITLQGWLEQIATLAQHLQELELDGATVLQQLGTIQQQYDQEINSLSVFTTHPQGQGVLTEIHRLLRLINTQGMFLKAARSPTKQQQHRATLADSLTTIIRLSQALGDSPSDPA